MSAPRDVDSVPPGEAEGLAPSKRGEAERLAGSLLAWYDRHRRDLPWRAPPGRRADPYAVWLSEIMLQQTTVVAAAPYFRRFLDRWPDVAALAAAPLDDVLAEWAGLGYYARARNLHAAAKAVAARGGFPRDVAGLRELPGVGAYTAAAIAAIAFDVRASAMDGNVERVVARLRAVEAPLPAAKKILAPLAEALVPDARAGDYAQALMDLGATICTPRRPACALCPWNGDCLARARGIAEDLPRKSPKAARPHRIGIAFWARRPDGAVLLRRRPETGLLGGMMEVPSTEWTERAPDAAAVAASAPLGPGLDWRPLPGNVGHVFTHFSLELSVLVAETPEVPAPEGARWVMPDDLGGAALPSVMRKVVAHVMGAPAKRTRGKR